MTADPITVSPSTSVQELVDDYIYRYHHKLYPVVRDGDLLGCVSLSQVKQIPKQEWAIHRVGELVRQSGNGNTIDAGADAIDALSRMSKEHVSRLMVVKDDTLVGIVSLKDLLKFLSLKVELETAGAK
jgi:predicted transcriptional regulator